MATNTFSLLYIQLACRNGIHQIVIKSLSEFRYLFQQLAYLVHSRIFPINNKISELLMNYHKNLAKSVVKHKEVFLIAVLVKSKHAYLSGIW
jgi:hypothetical protein